MNKTCGCIMNSDVYSIPLCESRQAGFYYLTDGGLWIWLNCSVCNALLHVCILLWNMVHVCETVLHGFLKQFPYMQAFTLLIDPLYDERHFLHSPQVFIEMRILSSKPRPLCGPRSRDVRSLVKVITCAVSNQAYMYYSRRHCFTNI